MKALRLFSPYRLGASVILCLCGFVGTALAQDFEAGLDGVCPEEPLQRSDGEGMRPSKSEIKDLQGSFGLQIVYPKRDMYQTAAAIDLVANVQLEFGTRVDIMQRSSSFGGLVLVRETQNSGLCGWINERDILNADDTRYVTDLPGYEDATGMSLSSASTLKAKVVVRAESGSEKLTKVALFRGPEPRDDFQLTPLEFFTISDVFRAERADGSDCLDIGDANCFLLLGGTERKTLQDGNETDIATIIGWARGKDISLWPSAISLDFKQGEANVPFYLTSCDAMGDGSGRICGGTEAGPSGFGNHRPLGDRNRPRFPIVNITVPADQKNDPFIYEIVTALRLCDASRENCRSSEGFLDETGVQGQVESELGNVDIVFVIDASASMEAYFKSVVQAAIDFSKNLEGTRINARFGAVVYEDYTAGIGTTQTVSINKIVPLGQRGVASNLNTLTATSMVQSSVRDVLRDPFEAPLAAISRTLEDGFVDWSQDSRLKVIVWIADIGNREAGKSNTLSEQFPIIDEKVTVDTIVDAVKALNQTQDSSVVFAGIHVPGEGKNDGLNSFRRDYNALAAKLGRDLIPLQIVQDTGAEGSTKDAIIAAFVVLRTAVNSMIGEGPKLALLPSNQAELPAFRIARQVLEERGLLDPNLRSIADGEVLEIENYFVRQDPEDPKFTYWMALRLEDVLDLQTSIGLLCDVMQTTDFADELYDTYSEVMEVVTRETIPTDIRLDEWISKKLSVPKDNFSDLLIKSEDRAYFGKLLSDTEERARVRANVCIKGQVFDYVRRGIAISSDDLITTSRGRVRQREGFVEKPFPWEWRPRGGVGYYFVPLSFLP